MTYTYGAGYPLPSSGHYNYYNGGGGYYGGYGPQFGGYGNFGPYQSPPLTPYEQLAAHSYHHEEETKGMITGGVIGGALGLLGGPFAPLTVPLGAVIGGSIGKFFGGMFGTNHDAEDNGKLDGSPLLMEMAEHHG